MQPPPFRNPSEASSPSAVKDPLTKPIKMPTSRSENTTESSIASYAPTVRPSPSLPRPQPHVRPHTTPSGAEIEWLCCFCCTPNSMASFAAAIASAGSSPATLPNCKFCGITGCIDCYIHAATPSQRDVPILPTSFPRGAPGSRGLWNSGMRGMGGMRAKEMEIARRRDMAEKADEALKRQIQRSVQERERETRRREERDMVVSQERVRMERELNELGRMRMRGRERWEEEGPGREVYESYEEEVKWAEEYRAKQGAQGGRV